VAVVPLPADPDLGPGSATYPTSARGPGFGASSDGTFSLKRLHGSTRFALAKAPEGWYLKSFAIGGVDVTDAPFDFGSSGVTFEGAEIVVSRDGASVMGSVTAEGGAAAVAPSVVVLRSILPHGSTARGT
jgi:hypothetical protein